MSFAKQYQLQHSELPLSLSPAECYGKTYIVTGSNSGIGFECAKHLVILDATHVILAVRSVERGRAAQAQIETDTGRKGVVDVWELDLSSYASVKAFAERARKDLERVDALIENATSTNGSWVMAEGLESTLTINIMSTFLLAILMMPQLRSCASRFATQPSVVFVTSSLGFGREVDIKKIGKGNLLHELSDNTKWSMDGANRYSLTKLLLMFGIRRLADLAPVSETGVVINYVCPGLAKTTLTKNSTFMVRAVMRILQMVMGRSAEWSSRNVLFGVAAGKESHGKFSTYCELRENWLPNFITNSQGRQMSQKIWEDVTVELEKIQSGCVESALRKSPDL